MAITKKFSNWIDISKWNKKSDRFRWFYMLKIDFWKSDLALLDSLFENQLCPVHLILKCSNWRQLSKLLSKFGCLCIYFLLFGSRNFNKNWFTYRISANSFRWNYSFLNLTLCTVTFGHSKYRCGNYLREETIQGWKLFAEIR